MLTLNPDVLLLPNFIQALVDAGQIDPQVGTVCGKLLTIRATFDLPDKPLVDSTGIYFTPMLRHLDRGSQEVDNGHYLQPRICFRRHCGGGVVPARDDRRHFASATSFSIPISSCIAKTPMSRGGRS